MRFSIRDILWLTVAVALAVGWWIDRSRLAIPAADYRLLKTEAARRKAEEAQILNQRAAFFSALLQQGAPTRPDDHLGPDGLRRVPGNKDYQFPPNYDEFLEVLRAPHVPPAPVDDQKLGPDGLRRVPGEKDFQFPLEYPLHYGPSRLP